MILLPLALPLLGCLTPEQRPERACTSCHGTEGVTASPPAALGGVTDPAHRGVGAHERHRSPNVGRSVACTECHLVPARIDAPGHVDSDWPAEVGWSESTIAGLRAEPFDADGLTCTVYCHTAAGASLPTPSWTGGGVGCSSCHGNPPPPRHPSVGLPCGDCHGGGGASNPDAHVDGVLQLTLDALPCDACHGADGDPAPPLDTFGRDDTSLVTVGAHQTHLNGTARSAAVPCDTCHVVPGTVTAPGHIDGGTAEVKEAAGFDLGPTAGGPAPATCTNACHSLPGGTDPEPIWTVVDGSQTRCGACHGNPPPPPHPDQDACESCHSTAGPYLSIAIPGQHVDGSVDF